MGNNHNCHLTEQNFNEQASIKIKSYSKQLDVSYDLHNQYIDDVSDSLAPISSKREQFLKQISKQSVIQVCLNKILNQEGKPSLKIPVSGEPKLLSSLMLNKKESKKQNFLQWKSILASKFEQTNQFDINKLPKSNMNSLLANYSRMVNQPKKQGLNYITINKQVFYQIRTQPIQNHYNMKQKIGEGTFGSVYKAFCKKTKQVKAIKILKKKFMSQKDQSNMLAQVSLLKKLDHINIIKLDDIFYNKCFYYIVTQFCQGGTLLDALIKKKITRQKQVSIVMRQVLSAVSYIHQMKIAHLDLKLENIVLVKNINSVNIGQCVKIIDFGLAIQSKKMFNNPCPKVGTLSYMAPQVLQNNFSCHSDIWSCGIIITIMLIGYNPFKKNRSEDTIRSILKQSIHVTDEDWKNVSNQAKLIVIGMLKKKPQRRLPINKILCSDWFRLNNLDQKNINENKHFMNKISKYYRENNFISFIKNYVISRGITQAQRQQMAIIFSKLDGNHSGFLQIQQILQLYQTIKGTPITIDIQQQIKSKIFKLDQNKSGKIDFQEFLMLMSEAETLKSKQYLNEAFDYFDKDKTGFIEKEELIGCLQSQDEVRNVIGIIDWNGDGKVSRDEFINYLMDCLSK